jgi:predicted unusual protein kinase regulating ubiquinone biosynthesis (AarF/ABC1/UbiB family)
MVDRRGSVVFIDFGITAWLDAPTRGLLVRELFALVVRRDFTELAEALCEHSVHDAPVDVDRVTAELAGSLSSLSEQPLHHIPLGQVVASSVEIGIRHGLRFLPDLVLLAKQLLCFERYAVSLAPGWDPAQRRSTREQLLAPVDPSGTRC